MWRWESDGSVAGYLNWEKSHNEPNNQGGNEHCVHLDKHNGEWNDKRCNAEYAYICGPLPGE